MRTCHLFLLSLFLASVGIIGSAHDDFFKFDHSLRHLFPYDGKALPNLKELDDGSIQRVVSILQSNIKQWSFVESQLLEPNVNLGMPEIFIPLGHLTTTLEVLGNILFMRDDIDEARQSLERACPLMELLPANFNDGNQYTTGCFAVLREVYSKMYQRTDTSRMLKGSSVKKLKKKTKVRARKRLRKRRPHGESSGSESDQRNKGSLHDSTNNLQDHSDDERREGQDQRTSHLKPGNVKGKSESSSSSSPSSSPPSSSMPESKGSDALLPSTQSEGQTRSRTKARRRIDALMRQQQDEGLRDGEESDVDDRNNDNVYSDSQNSRVRDAASTGISPKHSKPTTTEKDSPLASSVPLSASKGPHTVNHHRQHESGSVVSDDEDNFEEDDDDGYRDAFDDSDSDEDEYEDGDEDDVDEEYENDLDFDVDKRLNELRAPFDHLREELTHQQQSKQHVSPQGSMGMYGQPTPGSELPGGPLLVNMGNIDDIGALEPDLLAHMDASVSVGIAGDLDMLLRRFVVEDDIGKHAVLDLAKQYYLELSKHLQESSLAVQDRFADDLGLCETYLSVMTQAAVEGVSFIKSELDYVAMTLSDEGFDLGEDIVALSLSSLSKENKNRLLVLHSFEKAVRGELPPLDGPYGTLTGIDADGQYSADSMAIPSPLYWLSHYSDLRGDGEKGRQRAAPHEKGTGHDHETATQMFQTSTLANVDDIIAPRAAVPMVKEDLAVLYCLGLFLLALVALVVLAYQESQKRRGGRGRSRAQRKTVLELVQSYLTAICLGKHDNDSDEERDRNPSESRVKGRKVNSRENGLADHKLEWWTLFKRSGTALIDLLVEMGQLLASLVAMVFSSMYASLKGAVMPVSSAPTKAPSRTRGAHTSTSISQAASCPVWAEHSRHVTDMGKKAKRNGSDNSMKAPQASPSCHGEDHAAIAAVAAETSAAATKGSKQNHPTNGEHANTNANHGSINMSTKAKKASNGVVHAPEHGDVKSVSNGSIGGSSSSSSGKEAATSATTGAKKAGKKDRDKSGSKNAMNASQSQSQSLGNSSNANVSSTKITKSSAPTTATDMINRAELERFGQCDYVNNTLEKESEAEWQSVGGHKHKERREDARGQAARQHIPMGPGPQGSKGSERYRPVNHAYDSAKGALQSRSGATMHTPRASSGLNLARVVKEHSASGANNTGTAASAGIALSGKSPGSPKVCRDMPQSAWQGHIHAHGAASSQSGQPASVTSGANGTTGGAVSKSHRHRPPNATQTVDPSICGHPSPVSHPPGFAAQPSAQPTLNSDLHAGLYSGMPPLNSGTHLLGSQIGVPGVSGINGPYGMSAVMSVSVPVSQGQADDMMLLTPHPHPHPQPQPQRVMDVDIDMDSNAPSLGYQHMMNLPPSGPGLYHAPLLPYQPGSSTQELRGLSGMSGISGINGFTNHSLGILSDSGHLDASAGLGVGDTLGSSPNPNPNSNYPPGPRGSLDGLAAAAVAATDAPLGLNDWNMLNDRMNATLTESPDSIVPTAHTSSLDANDFADLDLNAIGFEVAHAGYDEYELQGGVAGVEGPGLLGAGAGAHLQSRSGDSTSPPLHTLEFRDQAVKSMLDDSDLSLSAAGLKLSANAPSFSPQTYINASQTASGATAQATAASVGVGRPAGSLRQFQYASKIFTPSQSAASEPKRRKDSEASISPDRSIGTSPSPTKAN